MALRDEATSGIHSSGQTDTWLNWVHSEVGRSLCTFTQWQTLIMWTLSMLRMRVVVLGALNVYSANHNDPPTLTNTLGLL